MSIASTTRAIISDSILVVDLAEAAESAFAVDPHRRIVFWSPASQELLGFSAEDVMGRRCYDVLCAGGGASCACGQCLRAGAQGGAVKLVSQFTTQVTALDGRTKQLGVTAVRTHSIAGDVRIVHFLRELPAPGPLVSDHVPDEEPFPDMGVIPVPQSPTPASASASAPMPAPHLTGRELEVLRLLASGMGTGEIATTLSISPITARNHITRVIEKLEVKTRLQAVITASRLGLI